MKSNSGPSTCGIVSSIFAAVFLFGCPPPSALLDSGTAINTYADFLVERFRIECTKQFECGQLVSLSDCQLADVPNEVLRQNFEARTRPATLHATFDVAMAQTCLTEVRAASCETYENVANFQRYKDGPCAFGNLFPPSRARGETCFGPFECDNDKDFCSAAAGVCASTCAARSPIGARALPGAQCVLEGYNLAGTCAAKAPVGGACVGAIESFFSCAGERARCLSGKCVIDFPFRAAGESCAGGANCGLGLVCDNGICVGYAKAGEACNSIRCQTGLGCVLGVCVADIERSGACAVCPNFSCQSRCASGSYCKALTDAQGTCEKYGAPGDACDAKALCRPEFYFCAGDGKCAQRRALGERCIGTEECQPETACVNAVCTAAACL
jgi:hypothetical protein